MKKSILLFFILAVILNIRTSAQQFITPVDYHNYIVKEQENVVNAVIDFSNNFNTNDSTLLSNYAKTKAVLKKSWDNIKNMPAYEGDTILRNASVPLFELYYSAMNTEYQEMVDLFVKKDFSKKTQERVTFLLNSINEREKNLDYLMKQAQANFAKKYNLEVQKNPTQLKVNELRK